MDTEAVELITANIMKEDPSADRPTVSMAVQWVIDKLYAYTHLEPDVSDYIQDAIDYVAIGG